MSDLVAFLRDRIDEDDDFLHDFMEPGVQLEQRRRPYHVGGFTPERLLREVEAKRKILALHAVYSEPEIKVIEHHDRKWNTGWTERQETGRLSYWCETCDADRDYGHIGGPEEGCPTVRALAAVYSDHPDYDPAWT